MIYDYDVSRLHHAIEVVDILADDQEGKLACVGAQGLVGRKDWQCMDVFAKPGKDETVPGKKSEWRLDMGGLNARLGVVRRGYERRKEEEESVDLIFIEERPQKKPVLVVKGLKRTGLVVEVPGVGIEKTKATVVGLPTGRGKEAEQEVKKKYVRGGLNERRNIEGMGANLVQSIDMADDRLTPLSMSPAPKSTSGVKAPPPKFPASRTISVKVPSLLAQKKAAGTAAARKARAALRGPRNVWGGGFRNTVQPLSEDDGRLTTLSIASGQRVKTTAAAAVVVVKAPPSQGSETPTANKGKAALKRPRNISGAGFRNIAQPLDEDDERLTPVSMEMSPRRKRERDGDEGSMWSRSLGGGVVRRGRVGGRVVWGCKFGDWRWWAVGSSWANMLVAGMITAEYG